MLSSKPHSRIPVKIHPGADIHARILIVDQDRKIGMTLSFMLAARHFDDVRSVRSAARALAIAEQFRPNIVFLDVELPDNGSAAVARQLARDASQSRVRLIALSSDPEHPLCKAARSAGLERVLLKPISHEELDKILGVSIAST